MLAEREQDPPRICGQGKVFENALCHIFVLSNRNTSWEDAQEKLFIGNSISENVFSKWLCLNKNNGTETFGIENNVNLGEGRRKPFVSVLIFLVEKSILCLSRRDGNKQLKQNQLQL